MRHALLGRLLPSLVTIACGLVFAGAFAQQGFGVDRMMVGTGVACRERPDASSAAVGVFSLGNGLDTAETREVGSDVWYLVRATVAVTREFDRTLTPSNCWVSGRFTTDFDPADPEPALIALADHALDNEGARFEDLVAVENVLTAPTMSETVNASAGLQARRLRIVDRASSRIRETGDALTQAWILAHGDLIEYWSIGNAWYVPLEKYWQLYEAFENEPGAEDIAWAGANARLFFDECYTICLLDLVALSRMQYWSRFPSGRHIDEALAYAVDRAEQAERFCVFAGTEILSLDGAQLGIRIDELRDSLSAVSANASDRATLLAWLADIESHCVIGPVGDLEDPRAIPGLARALGSGFTVVPRRLAGFGSEALPAILAVLRRPDVDTYVASDGLLALRYLTELSNSPSLSAGSLLAIRSEAARWLAMSGESILTLGNAIDLAIVLGDAELRAVVESLADDRGRIAALGLPDETSQSFIQRRARERLVGDPPLPRP